MNKQIESDKVLKKIILGIKEGEYTSFPEVILLNNTKINVKEELTSIQKFVINLALMN